MAGMAHMHPVAARMIYEGQKEELRKRLNRAKKIKLPKEIPQDYICPITEVLCMIQL